jgi:hypothetical protein
MTRWWKELDRILRGDATRPVSLKRGTIELPVGGLSILLVVLAMIHGACMGSFAVFRGSELSHLQVLASTLKVPALFVLTLVVTFPSLYVFNALVGSRLLIEAVLRLLIAALAVTVAVLASLGPIVAFFSASTTSYPFMVLLNVVVFVIAGLMGMAFLLQTLHRLSLFGPDPCPPEPSQPEVDPTPRIGVGVLDSPDERGLSRHVKVVFRCWILLFGLVGAQMGWVLRPFIGKPGMAFTWFRPRESNVFQGIMDALARLFS